MKLRSTFSKQARVKRTAAADQDVWLPEKVFLQDKRQ